MTLSQLTTLTDCAICLYCSSTIHADLNNSHSMNHPSLFFSLLILSFNWITLFSFLSYIVFTIYERLSYCGNWRLAILLTSLYHWGLITYGRICRLFHPLSLYTFWKDILLNFPVTAAIAISKCYPRVHTAILTHRSDPPIPLH